MGNVKQYIKNWMVEYSEAKTESLEIEIKPSEFKEKIDECLDHAVSESDDLLINISQKEELLKQKEIKLREREIIVEMGEKNLKNSLTKEKNWPFSFLKLARNDIENDIPVNKQYLAKKAYILWIMTSIALLINSVNLLLVMLLSTNVVQ